MGQRLDRDDGEFSPFRSSVPPRGEDCGAPVRLALVAVSGRKEGDFMKVGKEEAVLKSLVGRLAAICVASRVRVRQLIDKLESAAKKAEGAAREVLLSWILDAEEFLDYVNAELTALVLKMTRVVGVLIEKSQWGIKGVKEEILRIAKNLLKYYRQFLAFMLEKVGRGIYRQILQLADELVKRHKEEPLLTLESAEEIVKEIEEAEEVLKIRKEKGDTRREEVRENEAV